MILAVGPLIFLFLFFWQRREEISVAWQQRRIFPAWTYWGVAGLYALSGFIPMFSTFGATHFGIRYDSGFVQALTAIGLVYLTASENSFFVA